MRFVIMLLTRRRWFQPNNLSGTNYLLTKISAHRKKLKFYIEVEKGPHDDKAFYQDPDIER